MKKEDKYTMQLGTIHKANKVFGASLKVFKFIWRHAFVLISLGITIQGFCEGKTPIMEGEALIFTIAAFIDWLKMRFKFAKGHNNSREQMFQYAQEELDSSRFGSSAWAMNPMQPGSPANNLYSLGYMTTKYD